MEITGLVTMPSASDFGTTLEKFSSTLKTKGLAEFGRINYRSKAETSEKPFVLVLFGNAAAVKRVISKHPAVGVDLPMRAMFWEDQNGQVFVAFNDPAWVLARHGISGDVAEKLSELVRSVAVEATGFRKPN